MSDKNASTDHPIHHLLAARWSPYAFADRPVSDADLRSLFEAARWAPSSYNEQPWSYIVAKRESPEEFRGGDGAGASRSSDDRDRPREGAGAVRDPAGLRGVD